MRNLARITCALLVASSAIALVASAQEEEGESEESEFVRSGFYLGIGGTAAFPAGWDDDYNNDLNKKASDLANANAQENLEAIPAPGQTIPLDVTVAGAGLEDPLFGLNGVIGYRAGALVAFEVEGEWLISSNDTNLLVSSLPSDADPDATLPQYATGRRKAEVQKIWTVTGNVKVYAPFEIFTSWFQPFAKVGVGFQASELKSKFRTSGLTTTNGNGTIEVSADFEDRSRKRSRDGALRLGGGIDLYATRNIVAELNASYVVPFEDVGGMRTDYVSLQWRLMYRF